MFVFRQADAMGTVTASTQSPSQIAASSAGHPTAASVASLTQVPSHRTTEDFDIADLVVRIAGPEDAQALIELARRSGAPRPAGALMVAEAGNRLLAAVSMASGQALSEPTTPGAEARAVVRYTLARLVRRGRALRPVAA